MCLFKTFSNYNLKNVFEILKDIFKRVFDNTRFAAVVKPVISQTFFSHHVACKPWAIFFFKVHRIPKTKVHDQLPFFPTSQF